MWVEEKFLFTWDFYFYIIHVVVKPVTFLENWTSTFLIFKNDFFTYHGRSYSTLSELSSFSPQTFIMHYPLLCDDCNDQVRTLVLQRTLINSNYGNINSNYGEYNELTTGNTCLNIWNDSLRGQSFLWLNSLCDRYWKYRFLFSFMCIYLSVCIVYSLLFIYWHINFEFISNIWKHYVNSLEIH